jgi:hypothetical protein
MDLKEMGLRIGAGLNWLRVLYLYTGSFFFGSEIKSHLFYCPVLIHS